MLRLTLLCIAVAAACIVDDDCQLNGVCTAGACANGVCIQGATNYACMCNPGFAAAADQHSCAAVDPCANVMCWSVRTVWLTR